MYNHSVYFIKFILGAQKSVISFQDLWIWKEWEKWDHSEKTFKNTKRPTYGKKKLGVKNNLTIKAEMNLKVN